MSSLKLVESFVSINGEGQMAGALALFMRFAGWISWKCCGRMPCCRSDC